MPFVSTPTWQFLLADNTNATIADLSSRVLDPVVSPRLSVQSMQTWRVPLTPEVLALVGQFRVGERRGIAVRNGQVVANDILWRCKPEGGPNAGYATLEFNGPMIRWQRRYCQDANGQIFDGPSRSTSDRGLDLPAGIVANPTMTVAAGTMLKEALENTIANDGDLGITIGSFSSTPTPGGNVAFRLRNLSPLRVSELAALFRRAGALDIKITPTSSGSSQGTVDGLNRVGTDLPGVSFDYGTGANNVAWAFPEADMDEFANLLWYEILPRKDTNHFANNVTEDAPGVTASGASSRATFGTYHDIVIQAGWSGNIKNTSNLFKMYVKRYNAELAARMAPRQVVRVVGQPGIAPEPWSTVNLGDTPRLNLGQLGLDVSGASFRVIGWDARPQNDGPEHCDFLIGWAPE